MVRVVLILIVVVVVVVYRIATLPTPAQPTSAIDLGVISRAAAVTLACQKLHISPKKLTSVKTNIITGKYVISVSETKKYFIDPNNGNLLDESNKVINNLF